MKNKAFVVYVVLLFLAGAEIFTRLFVPDKVIPFKPSTNPRLVYELNPKYPGINSLGMRGSEIDLAHLSEKWVIAAVGDSHTYSSLVSDAAQSYPAQLEKELKARNKSRQDIAVLNFGVPGYNTATELELFKTKVLPFKPKLVLLQVTINDTHICNYLNPEHPKLNRTLHQSAALVRTWRNILYSSFGRKFLIDFIGIHYPDLLLYREGLVGTLKTLPTDSPDRRDHPARTPDRVPKRYHYMLGRENWERALREFGEIARQNEIRLIATGFVKEEDRELFQSAGFDVYSFYDIFQSLHTYDYGTYSDRRTSGHFNEAGCHWIASKLADYIKTHYQF